MQALGSIADLLNNLLPDTILPTSHMDSNTYLVHRESWLRGPGLLHIDSDAHLVHRGFWLCGPGSAAH